MKRHKWIIMGVLGLLAWLCMAFSSVEALDTNKIFPLKPGTFEPDTSSTVFITLEQFVDGSWVDKTAIWRPLPGEDVWIQVHNIDSPNIQLELEGDPDPTDPSDRVLTTSAYPGQYMNYNSSGSAVNALDFTLAGNILTPTDSRGMAVISVSNGGGDPLKFVIPADFDFDGMSDLCELQATGSVTGLGRDDDNETGPGWSTRQGDGIAAIDECGAFMVGGQGVPGDPTVKDLFLQFRESPECASAAEATLTDHCEETLSLGSFYHNPYNDCSTPDFTLLWQNANTLAPAGINIHLLKSEEMVDHFDSYDCSKSPLAGGGVQLVAGGDPVTDRQVNQFAIEPLSGDHSGTYNIVKAIRLIQALKTAGSSLGHAPKRPVPVAFGKDDGTAVVYPQRIWEYYKALFLSAPAPLVYYTYIEADRKWREQGSWPDPLPSSSDPFSVWLAHEGVRFIMREAAIPFCAAHEGYGHPTDQTPFAEATRRVDCFYHHCEGTGTLIDMKIQHKDSNKGNLFYIPKYFGSFDLEDLKLLETH